MAISSAEWEADDALPLSNVSQAVFERHVKTLFRNYGPTDPDQVKGKKLLYAEELAKQPWVTDAVFIRAVNLTVADSRVAFFPPVGVFLETCHRAKDDLEREAERRQAVELSALPPPARDDNSSTPQERERWAQEDVQIRAWAARLGLYDRGGPRFPCSPEVLARMPAADREALIEQHRNDVSVAGWPDLSPAARRAKEARIAGAKAQVDAVQAAAARQQRERRAAFLATLTPDERRGKGGLGGGVIEVRWKDGELSRVELAPPPAPHDSEEDRKAREEALSEKGVKAPDYYECLCGVAVVKYPNGRLREQDGGGFHACPVERGDAA